MDKCSNCCNAPIIENTGLCSECKEHCEVVDCEVYYEEYTKEDEAYDKASSNAGELI